MFLACRLLEPTDAVWVVEQVIADRETVVVSERLSHWPRRRQRQLTVLDAVRAEAVLQGCRTDEVCGTGRGRRWRQLWIHPGFDGRGDATGVREPRRPKPSAPARHQVIDPTAG